MRCIACGTENREGSRFCDSCGTPLASACPSCGEANRSDASFCSSCGARLSADGAPAVSPAAAASSSVAERRLVTVLFADLVGFTSLSEDRDPEAVRGLLDRYFATATEVMRLHGGTVEKFIGDAVMAVWGTPIAHEDDAERAVRAALELVDAVSAIESGLQARAGVLTGEAAVTLGATNQGMVAGDIVNTAARLQGVAEPGTVLVGEATRRAAESAVVFEPVGDHDLKGKVTPVPAWRAMRVVAARGGQQRADGLEAPFVGRDEEMRQLKEVLHAVGRERRPRLVSITGPGGIGKSRLVWELEKYVDGVSEDIYWHRGRSPSYGEGITFWALGEMVRRRAGLAEDDDEATTRDKVARTLTEYVADTVEREELAPALLSLLGIGAPPPGGRDALFPAWRTFFERIADRGTAVLVFEDLHWADAGLLDFIDHVLDWSRGLPIMVVTLARPELFDRRPDWGSGHRHLTALALEPLSTDAMRELLEGLVPGLPSDAVAAIVARAEGVPLYAVEMVRGLLADGRIERRGEPYVPIGDVSDLAVPESLRSLIAARLDALDPADRALVQDAAVLGQVFSGDALEAVIGEPTDALQPRLQALVRRELLDIERDPRSPERGQYKFVQSLIREVAYGTLARRDRRARHLAVARHYEAVGDEALAGALADHYLSAHAVSDAGAEADAVASQARIALAAAADRAASLGGHDQALALLERALAVTAAPGERAGLLDRAARSAIAASRDAERFATEAVDAYRELGDAVAAAGATARLGKALIDNGEVGRARDLLASALPAAEALDDGPVLAETLVYLARANMRYGDSEAGVGYADRSLAIAERLNLEPIIIEGLLNKGSSYGGLGRRREAASLLAGALELAIRTGERTVEIRIRNNLASTLFDDEPRRAYEMTVEALEAARAIGDRGMYNWSAGQAGINALSLGREWDRHLPAMWEAYETATLPGDRLRLRVLIGALECERGVRVDELRADITDIFGDSDDPEMRFAYLMGMANALDIRGDHGAAAREAMRALDPPPQSPEVPLQYALRSAAAALDGDVLRAAAHGTADVALTGAWSDSIRAEARGALAAIEGRDSDAVAAFAEARSIAVRIGVVYEAALVTLTAARLLPDHPDVRRWATEARTLFAELGAEPRIAALDAALGRADAPATKPITNEVEARP